MAVAPLSQIWELLGLGSVFQRDIGWGWELSDQSDQMLDYSITFLPGNLGLITLPNDAYWKVSLEPK